MRSFSKHSTTLNGRSITTASRREPRVDDSPIPPSPVAPQFAGTWALAYTEPRREALAVESLQEAGWLAYCPMETVWVTRAHIKRRSHQALFPRYVFVGLTETGNSAIRSCKGVAGLIGSDCPMAVPPRVIYGLSDRQASGEFDRTRTIDDLAARYSIGQVIRLSHGAMDGHTGAITAIFPDGRVRLLMSMLGGEIPVEIGLDQVAQIS